VKEVKMPNGHNYSKEYGKHKYAGEGTSDCQHGCGCWMGPARSDGPVGLDPFGECPGNPVDGKQVGGKADYEIVVTRRIRALESRAYQAETELEKLKKIENTPKAKLAKKVEILEGELMKKIELLQDLRNMLR